MLACGAWAGGASARVDDWAGLGAVVAARLRALADAVLDVLPGNAWAAASANTAVSATLPAISQRFSRLSWRSAASRVWAVWIV